MNLRLYEVTVPGYGSGHYHGRSPTAAKAEAFRSDAFNHLTLRDFLKLKPQARQCATPSPDGYDYVRRRYGVDVRIGEKVRLKNEGPRWDGKEGVVLYPGPHTAHVHVLMDGAENGSWFHPRSIETGGAP